MTRSVSYFLEQGHWFLSLYNDDMDAQEVSFVIRVSEELTQNCPKGCSGKGQCVLGRCQCEAGYDGPDCGQSKSIDSVIMDSVANFRLSLVKNWMYNSVLIEKGSFCGVKTTLGQI